VSTPLVSIITPSYNQASFLEASLRSMLEQKYPSIEYLVVDGGSTDGSVEIIRKYADRLAWWVSEPDHGQAEAINKGFRRAQGEFIAWLNSDDQYLPGAVAAAVAAFQEHPAAGLVYGDVLAVDEADRRINLMRFGDHTLLDLMSFKIIGQPAVFMRRSALDQAGELDASYHFLLDHHLWLRIASQTPMVHIPKTLAAARYHPQAKNVARAAEFGAEAHRLVIWMPSQPALAPLFTQYEKRIRAGAFCLDAFYLTDGGKPASALHSYKRAFQSHPLTALKAGRRIGYSLLCLLGLGGVHAPYRRLRNSWRSRFER
jgi:glycosyltransferase involved in cell wall biosynthesis